MIEFKFGVLAFVSLLTVVNPLAALPVYLTLAPEQASASRRMALRVSLVALSALTLFAFAGQMIFDLFSVSLDGLRLVGGILFFIVGYDMLRGEVARTKGSMVLSEGEREGMAITPLGVPLIAGPGAISTVMILMSQTGDVLSKGVLVAAIVAVMAVTFLLLSNAQRVMSFLGQNGSRLLGRIMGLIVMMVAVEFFFAGLKPFVQSLWPTG